MFRTVQKLIHKVLIGRGCLVPMSLVILVGATLLWVPGASAQSTPSTAFGEQVDVRVINLEAVVTDAKGNFVPGLTVNDFRLLVDGREVTIDYFSEIRNRVATAAAASGQVPNPSVTPGQKVGTSYLLFVDNFFGIKADRDRVLDKMRQDLAGFDPADQMAIVAFDGRRLDLLSSWSSSPAELSRVLEEAKEMRSLGLQRRGELSRFEAQNSFQSAGQIQETTNTILEDYAQTLSRQVDTALAAATTALRTFAQPSGRKVMLLASGGWPIDPRVFAVGENFQNRRFTNIHSSKKAFDNLTSTANLLGYTLYPIDMPGLRTVGGAASERLVDRQAESTLQSGSVNIANQGLSTYRENTVESTLLDLARETGGEAMINGLRDSALATVRRDLSSYYWLGFSPRRARDDRLHEIEIEVLQPGLEVRSRQGFKDLSRSTEVTMQVESELLFDSGLDSGPRLDVQVGGMKKARKGIKVDFVLRVPLDQVVMLPVKGGFEANLELRVAALEEDGDRSEIPVTPVKFGGPTAPQPGQFASYQTTVQLRRKKQRLVMALYDLAGEGLMTAEIEFDPKGL